MIHLSTGEDLSLWRQARAQQVSNGSLSIFPSTSLATIMTSLSLTNDTEETTRPRTENRDYDEPPSEVRLSNLSVVDLYYVCPGTAVGTRRDDVRRPAVVASRRRAGARSSTWTKRTDLARPAQLIPHVRRQLF